MARISRVVVERVAQCPFSVAHDYAADFLRDAERATEVRLPLRDLVYGLRGAVARPVKLIFALHPDDTEGGRIHDAMIIDWTAGTRLFPDFHGTLRMRIETIASTRLTFEGAYRPPLGPLGGVFDVLVGARIARASMGELLDRIVGALELRESEFRREMAEPAGATPQEPGPLAR